MPKTEIIKVDDYIRKSWPLAQRDGASGKYNVLSLPRPYSVPCIDGTLQFLFYWDTCFTNIGLIRHGLVEMAIDNVENLFYMLDEFGYIPNSTALSDTNRSQPPYLSRMVRDIYEVTGDKAWLARAVDALKNEYEFWMAERITPIGLNRHYHSASNSYLINFARGALTGRLKIDFASRQEKLEIGSHYLAEAETGWDFTPRFAGRCADFAPIDLNSNLFYYEENFAFFSDELGLDEKDCWLEKAQQRRDLCNRYLWDDQAGLFLDYDYINSRRSEVKSLASYHPLWTGLAGDAQAQRAADALADFENPLGLAACAEQYKVPKVPITEFQWGYPSGWAILHYVTSEGLARFGFDELAERVAGMYMNLVAENFKKTGLVWEKYDVCTGGLCNNEYPSQDHLGWTAGVFVAFKQKYID